MKQDEIQSNCGYKIKLLKELSCEGNPLFSFKHYKCIFIKGTNIKILV